MVTLLVAVMSPLPRSLANICVDDSPVTYFSDTPDLHMRHRKNVGKPFPSYDLDTCLQSLI